MKKFTVLDSKPNFGEFQPEVIKFWKDNNVFEKSVEQQTEKEVVFYDGPPFPTGKPHHGTVLVSFIKDMISRYWTMQGYSVPRVWGWDCHGLPIENQAETALGITDKNEIERNLGIDKFNDKCFEIVSNNNDAWREYVEQMARWVDYDGAYKTMTPEFMESVMWAFKECYNKGLIYRDYRVTPYCTHCETSLSISDTRESDSTRPRQDRWIVVKFKSDIKYENRDVFLLAWTTTPWTLPSNLCLAVGKELDYAFVEVESGEIYVACVNTLKNFKNVFGEEPKILKVIKGEELVGVKYEPIFNYFADKKNEGAFRVVLADYVGAEDGVGIVHTAPAFGEDDYWTCKANKIPLVNPVDSKGQFTEEVTDFYPLQENKTVIEMNPIVIRFLYEKGVAVADGTIEHNYPHCWRCKRPLIYKAMDAYYFNIDKIKDKLIANNDKVNWVPETVKYGRFGNWLDGARDWNISRNRYWSTPIPIWKCDCCDAQEVLGSIAEIYEKSGVKLDNLHRQFMDKVTFKCKCGGTMTRVPEVLDCWFESGSVPFASKHYPFENKEWFESHFPSDFVVEYTGQIRCWFYYLHVLATALFERPAFKNAVVHGTILAKDGKKLSKSSKNYTDPMELMKKFGTDAFRLYLYQTKAMLIGDLLFDESGIADSLQQIILPYWNACNFFISYANIDGFCPGEVKTPNSQNSLDKWILAKLYDAEKHITKAMNEYRINEFVPHLTSVIDGLTNWYIRRSRRRFWASGMDKDKQDAYETLYYVLINLTKLMAPVAPIITEKVYKSLTEELSVHLTSWPNIPDNFKDEKLLKQIDSVQRVIYLARSVRNKCRIKNRQPLSLLKIASSNAELLTLAKDFANIIEEEINVKNIAFIDNVEDVASIKYDPNFNEIRNRYPQEIPTIIQAVKKGDFKFTDNGVVLGGNEEKVYDESIILVTYLSKDGDFVASDRELVVSLDTTITKELAEEGLAREVVRSVQDARKQIGCEIMDKIKIQIIGEFPENWKEYVYSETLSSFENISTPTTTIDLEDENIKILILK